MQRSIAVAESRSRAVAATRQAILRPKSRSRWADAALLGLLAAAAGAAAWYGSCGIDEPLIRRLPGDVWFEADCRRVFDNLAYFRSVQGRTTTHPLLTLWLQPPVALVQWLGLVPILAVRALRVLTAAGCAAALYVLLRAIGCRRLDSVALCVLAGVSSAAIFWFVVPETYPLGLLSILVALNIAAFTAARRSLAWDLLAQIATFSFTITNWMAGLLVTFARWPWRRALAITGLALCLVQILVVLQNQIYPSAALWLDPLPERIYVLHPAAGGPARVLPSFIFHSMVMPRIDTTDRAHWVGPMLTVQESWPGSAGPWGIAAVVAWTALLSLGLYGLATLRGQGRLRAVLGLTLAGQLVLHLLYGLETFTYACHFGPLLVVVAALATLTRARRVALGLILALIVCAGINNLAQFKEARTWVEQRAAARRPGPACATDSPRSATRDIVATGASGFLLIQESRGAG